MQKRWNAALDCLIVVLLPLLMAYSLIGESIHEWLGIAMLLLFLGHHALNWRWYRGLPRGKWPPARVLQTVVNTALLLVMAGLAVSGIIMSRYVFSLLPVRGGRGFARTLHMLIAYWGFCVMSLHLGLHWGMVLAAGRKLVKNPPPWGKAILRVGSVLVCLWGVYAFARRELGAYLLLQTAFVFFNFEEPLALFLLDYLAMMGMLAMIGYYGKKLLLALDKQKNQFSIMRRKFVEIYYILQVVFTLKGN